MFWSSLLNGAVQRTGFTQVPSLVDRPLPTDRILALPTMYHVRFGARSLALAPVGKRALPCEIAIVFHITSPEEERIKK